MKELDLKMVSPVDGVPIICCEHGEGFMCVYPIGRVKTARGLRSGYSRAIMSSSTIRESNEL